ncbi:hypothetical protein EAI_02587 [Harpegnathos saltator]|uniref:Uncharacterized protein n=1 Tax=Harpegnathos saltator TaxID=610380 RepID=E2C803_HARSA|nr:hypothetical protein EAI_02587 [Harpegnathos saltator]
MSNLTSLSCHILAVILNDTAAQCEPLRLASSGLEIDIVIPTKGTTLDMLPDAARTFEFSLHHSRGSTSISTARIDLDWSITTWNHDRGETDDDACSRRHDIKMS